MEHTVGRGYVGVCHEHTLDSLLVVVEPSRLVVEKLYLDRVGGVDYHGVASHAVADELFLHLVDAVALSCVEEAFVVLVVEASVGWCPDGVCGIAAEHVGICLRSGLVFALRVVDALQDVLVLAEFGLGAYVVPEGYLACTVGRDVYDVEMVVRACGEAGRDGGGCK